MNIQYDTKNDLLYLRFESTSQIIINRRVSEDIVLDIGADDKIVGIEILDASKHVNLEKIIPIEYSKAI
jgi:uncharacterized protein YuzE